LKDSTATLLAGSSVEKRLLYHIIFNGILCYIFPKTLNVRIILQAGLVVNLVLAKTAGQR